MHVKSPAYAAAIHHYQASRAAYEAALNSIDDHQTTLYAWREKVKQKAYDNPKPNGLPDFDLIISPDDWFVTRESRLVILMGGS